MSDDKTTFETKGIPTAYCNQASVALSYNEIRIYLFETTPSELVVDQSSTELLQKKPHYESKISLVFSPEFGRALAKAIAGAVEQYEGAFGPLRPEPKLEQIKKAFAKKK
jgi:hypothetical protein